MKYMGFGEEAHGAVHINDFSVPGRFLSQDGTRADLLPRDNGTAKVERRQVARQSLERRDDETGDARWR